MTRQFRHLRTQILSALVFVFCVSAFAFSAPDGPRVESLGPNLYAYISDNDGSANSTFLVGPKNILVVDSGIDRTEGEKILREIRKLSPLPVQYIVNTHYHPDHQGGNGVVGPEAVVISSPFTRERTVQFMAQLKDRQAKEPAGSASTPSFAFRLATETLTQQLTVYVDEDPVQIIAPGPGHTLGDVYVFFPNQR